MLDCQRSHFDIPRDVCFMSAASYSPLPLAVQAAGHRGVQTKGRPWMLGSAFRGDQFQRVRRAAAHLINAAAEDVALISSVAYGFATIAKLLPVPRGSRVLVLENDHASPVLIWHAGAEAGGYTVEAVPQPSDGDWTSALLEAIERPGAPEIALASLSNVHWSDGCVVDLAVLSAALKAHGAALALDATHAVGASPLDVAALDPDFVVFPTYKWLLGPYGRAFLYVAKRHQDGPPLEQTTSARRRVKSEDLTYFSDLTYVEDARRFDMAERDYFITIEMASVGMEMIADWGQEAISERLGWLTDSIAARLDDIAVPNARLRAPHLLCLGVEPERAGEICKDLSRRDVYVSPRLGRIRVAPHIYNDEDDIERFVAAFRDVIR